MGTYTPVNPDLQGATPNLVAVSASDNFVNDGRQMLHVHNGNAGTLTLTVTDHGDTAPDGASAFDGDVVVTLATGTDKYLGPFDTQRFNDATGKVTVGYSPTSSVTAEVIDTKPKPS